MLNHAAQTSLSNNPAIDFKESLRRFILDDLLMGQTTPLADDDDLLLSGLVDSLGVVRLVTFIETEFNIVVPPEDVVLENFQTLNATAEYLHRQQTA